MMAKTIEQLQAFIDTNPDIRQLVNEITDYLQANPSGNGGSGLPSQTGNSGKFLKTNGSAASWGNTINNDIEITDFTKGVILPSPNATRWRITINNSGALVTTQI